MIDWFGPVINEYYGSTEASVNTVVSSEEWLQEARHGRPPAADLRGARTRARTAREAGTDERGQLWFRYTNGDDIEYWRDPEKTAGIHREDGLFTTGDIGYLDADGYLFLADRAIDMIISGGVNIYPAEIEGVLIDPPGRRATSRSSACRTRSTASRSRPRSSSRRATSPRTRWPRT